MLTVSKFEMIQSHIQKAIIALPPFFFLKQPLVYSAKKIAKKKKKMSIDAAVASFSPWEEPRTPKVFVSMENVFLLYVGNWLWQKLRVAHRSSPQGISHWLTNIKLCAASIILNGEKKSDWSALNVGFPRHTQ